MYHLPHFAVCGIAAARKNQNMRSVFIPIIPTVNREPARNKLLIFTQL